MIRRTELDERGAVVLVVALTVTFVLLPVAALALDLGTYYVREASLQQIADDAATAGASELAVLQRDDLAAATVMREVRAKTVSALCAVATGSGGGWPDACTGSRTWAEDGDETNGEVSFYRGAPTADHSFLPTQEATGATTSEPITGIRVVTPPSRVTFGLAGSLADGEAEARRTATAGLFTVLPAAGFLPMFLRPGERGVFCTRSAPKTIWEDISPYLIGACSSAVARGNLAAPRTDPAQNISSMTWNTATGFDRQHLPLPGLTATLQSQSPYSRVRDLSPGLFVGTGSSQSPARLKRGTCPGTYSTSSGPYSGLENAYLASFVNDRVGDKYALRDVIKSGDRPTETQRGWLDPSVLRCGRLAVVPMLNGLPDPLPDIGLTSLTYPVTDLRLIWLDDRLWAGEAASSRAAYGPCLDRGFYWGSSYSSTACQTSAIRAYTGYVLDPRLLPATVDGANATNVLPQYIGSGLPVTVRLLRDVP